MMILIERKREEESELERESDRDRERKGTTGAPLTPNKEGRRKRPSSPPRME